jgi:hypothetical protein
MIFFIAQLSKISNKTHGASIVNDNMYALLSEKFDIFQTHYTNKFLNNVIANYVVFIYQFFITTFTNISKKNIYTFLTLLILE